MKIAFIFFLIPYFISIFCDFLRAGDPVDVEYFPLEKESDFLWICGFSIIGIALISKMIFKKSQKIDTLIFICLLLLSIFGWLSTGAHDSYDYTNQ